MRYTLFLTLPLILSACANVNMVPHDVAEVDFDAPEGKTGWSQYQHVETFRGYTEEQVYEAAKVALGSAGFSLRMADKTKGTVIGEHGMTAHDWNVIAGVYFKHEDNGTKVKVIAEGSKDIGLSGDVTSDGWTGKILRAMRQYLNETHQTILKVNKKDIEKT